MSEKKPSDKEGISRLTFRVPTHMKKKLKLVSDGTLNKMMLDEFDKIIKNKSLDLEQFKVCVLCTERCKYDDIKDFRLLNFVTQEDDITKSQLIVCKRCLKILKEKELDDIDFQLLKLLSDFETTLTSEYIFNTYAKLSKEFPSKFFMDGYSFKIKINNFQEYDDCLARINEIYGRDD